MAIATVEGKELALTRFEIPLTELEKLVDSSDQDETVLETLTTKGGRNPAFALQELFRLYEDEKKLAKQWRKVSKQFEDLIGRRTDVSDWRLFLVDLPVDAELKAKVNKYLDGVLAIRTAESLKELQALRKDDVLGEMRADIQDWNFHSKKEDREIVLSALQAHLKSIESKKYDLNVLEGSTGIHEFRRDIRQFLIASRALNGLVVLDASKCELKQYKALLEDPIAKKPYNVLPENKEEKMPCGISKCLYLGLSKISDDLSEAKDMGQGEHMLKAYFVAQKDKSPEKAAYDLAKHHPAFHDYRARAKKVRQELLHDELLYWVRQDLKACRD